ncbi:hypothetical protein [Devosia sp. LjRoot3]|uniref:hypothetical protein n=1 Tax=Devosia sp. LjRoot3 TaxID=3342319 RepID=UPI003ED09C16
MSFSPSSPFIPPERSRATRPISLTGRNSFRGALVAKFGGIDQIIAYESLLERGCLHMLLADPNVNYVWEQPPAISFLDIEGTPRKHTLDFLATYSDGRQIGFACKPHKKVWNDDGSPTKFRRDMARVAAIAGFPIKIVTEKSFSRIQLQDAQLMHICNSDTDEEADAAVLSVMQGLKGTFPVRTLADITSLEGRAFRSAVRLFRAGRLVKCQKRRFAIDTLVEARLDG